MIKVLHTSDWHIGKSLYAKKRYDEFGKFLDWLVGLIVDESIDVLLISGDIFDTTTPSNRALELYYSFLSKTSKTCCKKIIITGGNHDSATSLDAPKQLLDALNISVIGSARDDISEEVICVLNADGEEQLIVCAVPYLRERDIRIVEAGESIADKADKLRLGVRKHYKVVVEAASSSRSRNLPLIVMGHLFAASAMSSDDGGERELYVGALAHVDVDELPQNVDYYALGHLHIPQKIGGSEYKRYSGSPIQMGFGEAGQKKVVLKLEFDDNSTKPEITEIAVPVFQRLNKVVGDLDEILVKLDALILLDESIWVEVDYTGKDIASELIATIDEKIQGSKIEVRRVRNLGMLENNMSVLKEVGDVELDELCHSEVFEKCLAEREFSDIQVGELWAAYNEISNNLVEKDVNAE